MISIGILYDDTPLYLPLLLQSMEGIEAIDHEVFVVAKANQNVPKVFLYGKEVPVISAEGNLPSLYNVAMQQAKGDWVLFCKADVIFERGFFANLSKKTLEANTVYCAEQNRCGQIGGSILGWQLDKDSLWYSPSVFSKDCRQAGYAVYQFSESCFLLPKSEIVFDEGFQYSLFEYAAIFSNSLKREVLAGCVVGHRDIDYMEKILSREADLAYFEEKYPALTISIKKQGVLLQQQEYQQQQKHLQELQDQLKQKQAHIELLLQSERDLKQEQTNLEQQIIQLKQDKLDLQEQHQQTQLVLQKKESDLRKKVLEITSLKEKAEKLPSLEQHCANLTHILNQIYASRTWRYPHRAATLFRKFFPTGTLRGKIMVSILAAPIHFEHAVRAIPRNIKQTMQKKAAEKAALEAQKHWFEKAQPLCFVEKENPLVSIIIPVYNQVEYTYNCLKSISETCRGISYEVILADDNSTDDTKRLGEKVQGLKIIRNPENLRFLLNCNNAAQYAKGEYIVFLNNDTLVHRNWLQSMLDLMEQQPSCGLVGSKMVFANGTLQEAGGIVWNNANAWNYGRGQDPELPEFNYVKEVDYISGCSIMIRASLWKEIGGFDTRFAPAYYEDTDLAFEVRAHGYKVMYQPASVITHFEGISNGSDLTQGQKAYQVLNREKFFEKWQEVLQKEHFDDAQDVFLARDRSKNRSVVFITDYSVPHYDKDAGSKCTTMYTHLFASLGLKVIFMGDNFYRYEPYCSELQQAGIEVLYGNEYALHWREWLQQNGKYINYAYMNRPDFTIKYIDAVKEYTPAKIIYFGHDLHHLRMQREYELTGDKALLPEIEKFESIEYHLVEQADTVYVVGSYEQEFLQKRFPQKPVYNIPVYIYDGVQQNINRDFEQRKDILFVGSFGHKPNPDAVLWFAENVFPKVLEHNPQMRWIIVGSKPPKEVQDLACSNIIVTGFVSDEKLEEYYRTCRLAVIPLRVGAGVKGKVIEAAYYGLPILTSPIGAEGLSTQEGAMQVVDVTDDGSAMTEAVNALYNDIPKLQAMSTGCEDFINHYFTLDVAKQILLKDVKKDNLR